MKYSEWVEAALEKESVEILRRAGYGVLAARVLAARGVRSPQDASVFLSCAPDRMFDPFLLADMRQAVSRIEKAVKDHEFIAIYGDYDVDGITATCLLVRYLAARGAQVDYYIPNRLTDGYGLKTDVLTRLRDQGVTLVVTVDTGTTALEEADHAKCIGLDLVITDHHQCADRLPRAVAVVNPCRPDNAGLPFTALAGVGVVFKLICALEPNRPVAELLSLYGDLAALGTVADVMPLLEDNRVLVRHGLTMIEYTENRGLSALMKTSALPRKNLSVSALSYGLAPRLNAAGRLGQAHLSAELLLTDDRARADRLAQKLCDLNRHRGILEAEMIEEAVAMMDDGDDLPIIVLAHEGWSPGILGIVAARLSVRFARPTFLIGLQDGVGQGSARSAGGFPIMGALNTVAPLLTRFGGHETAAGFVIEASKIDEFRRQINAFAMENSGAWTPPSLAVDVCLPAKTFTLGELDALSELAPFGAGHKAPVFLIRGASLIAVTPMGGGKHVRLSFAEGETDFDAVFFGVDPLTLGLLPGDVCDLAFHAEINEFRGRRRAQFLVVDIRLAHDGEARRTADLARLDALMRDDFFAPEEKSDMMPDRNQMAAVWRFLKQEAGNPLTADLHALSRLIARKAGADLTAIRVLVALETFAELDLLVKWQVGREVTLELTMPSGKVDLARSSTLGRLGFAE